MADFQREKLIDLKIRFVEGFDCGDCPPANDKCRKCLTEKEADYLLQNGVIVPPCKVGDTVYRVYADDCGNQPCMGNCWSCENAYWKVTPTSFKICMCDEIGKTVFLTPEEAEKALAEIQSI